MKEFDEEEAVMAMRAVLTENEKEALTEDDIYEIIDLIFDAYDELGLLDIDDDDADEEAEQKAVIDYVGRYLHKSGRDIAADTLARLVAAENDYEQTLI